jgi:hypothetical protein
MDMDKRYSHNGLMVSTKDLIREEPYEVKVSRTVRQESRLGDKVA